MDYKDVVLHELGLEKLPSEAQLGAKFEGKAPIKIKKVNGGEIFAIGHFQDGKTLVAKDFKRGMIEKIINVYPIPQPKKVDEVAEKLKADKLRLVDMGYTKTTVKSWNGAKVAKELVDIEEIKVELNDLGEENPRGTLSELQAKKLELTDK